MYSYKLNNSNTIYVYWNYNNKIRKKNTTTHNNYSKSSHTSKSNVENTIVERKITPLPKGTSLKSKYYGIGILVSTTEKGIMTLDFDGISRRFVYPDALQDGYLSRIK